MPGNALSSVFIPKFLAGVAHRGHDPAQVLRECGLDPELLTNPGLTLDYWEFSRLSRRIIELLGDENHGLTGVPQSLGTNELVAMVLTHRATLDEATEMLAAISNRRKSGFSHLLHKSVTNCEYRVYIEQDCEMLNEFAIEAALLYRHRLLCWLCGHRIPITQLHLPYAPPEWKDEYRYMYAGAAVLFDAGHAGFTFARSYLSHPIVQDEHSVSDQLTTAFGALPQVEVRLGSLSIQVRDHLFHRLAASGELMEIEELSSMLNMEIHTLRRRLRKEGLSFKELCAIARQDLAVKLLNQQDASIEEVALQLGYVEPSSFTRAFKAWTGMTPMGYRRAGVF